MLVGMYGKWQSPPNDHLIQLFFAVGMGLMLATIWIHLGTSTDKINDRLSVLYVDLPLRLLQILSDDFNWDYSFFSVAFLGFMSVAGIPAFLEVNDHDA